MIKNKKKPHHASLRDQPSYRVRFSQSIKRTGSIFLIVVMVVSVVWGVVTLNSPHAFPFRTIKIKANANHIKVALLKETVASHLKGGFFSLHSLELRQALLALPWVADVSLRRVWPNQLKIGITEQSALARWGKSQLINRSGELFQPVAASIPRGLPLLCGPKDSLAELVARYQSFSKALSPIGVTISEIRLSDRHAWRMVLNDHIEVMMGRSDIDQRFERFVALYPRIIGKNENNVEAVDLRYPRALQQFSTHNKYTADDWRWVIGKGDFEIVAEAVPHVRARAFLAR